MATAKKRKSDALSRADRRRKVSEMYVKAMAQIDIAAELGCSQKTVSRDIAAIKDAWLQSALVNFDEAQAEALAKVDRLENEYWTAWESSKKDRVKRSKTENRKGDDEDTRLAQEVHARDGNPSFLQGVQWCIDRRVKILGLDAPQKRKVEHSGSIDVSQLSDDELDSLIATLEGGEGAA